MKDLFGLKDDEGNVWKITVADGEPHPIIGLSPIDAKNKPLPKNLEELVKLLYDFRDFDKKGKHTVREFIISQNFDIK